MRTKISKDTYDFYHDHNLDVGRVVEKGVNRRGLTKRSLRSAMVQIYDDIKEEKLGFADQTRKLGHEIYRRAQTAADKVVDSQEEEIERLWFMVHDLQNQLAYKKLPWYKKLFWRTHNDSTDN